MTIGFPCCYNTHENNGRVRKNKRINFLPTNIAITNKSIQSILRYSGFIMNYATRYLHTVRWLDDPIPLVDLIDKEKDTSVLGGRYTDVVTIGECEAYHGENGFSYRYTDGTPNRVPLCVMVAYGPLLDMNGAILFCLRNRIEGYISLRTLDMNTRWIPYRQSEYDIHINNIPLDYTKISNIHNCEMYASLTILGFGQFDLGICVSKSDYWFEVFFNNSHISRLDDSIRLSTKLTSREKNYRLFRQFFGENGTMESKLMSYEIYHHHKDTVSPIFEIRNILSPSDENNGVFDAEYYIVDTRNKMERKEYLLKVGEAKHVVLDNYKHIDMHDGIVDFIIPVSRNVTMCGKTTPCPEYAINLTLSVEDVPESFISAIWSAIKPSDGESIITDISVIGDVIHGSPEHLIPVKINTTEEGEQ